MRLTEVGGRKRKSSHQLQQLIKAEGEQMLKAVPDGVHVVALDVNGRQWNTEELSEVLARWMTMGRDVALLVGGPEGLSPECKALASESWGLSRLTFPHPLVRIIVVEQLYRAWSLLRNHPYHR